MNIEVFNEIKQFLTSSNPIYLSVSVFLFSIVALFLVKKIIIRSLSKIAKKTGSKFDDVIVEGINKISWPFYLAIPIYFSSFALDISENTASIVNTIALAILTIYIIRFLDGVLSYFINKAVSKSNGDEESNKTIKSVFRIFMRFVLWSLGLLLIIQNLGVNVSAVLGGLGIGGIAIAFALQATLEDLFSFFSIYFDKPFKVGDLIVIGEDRGVVEQIGIKSTRLRTLQGEELILSNNDLTNSRINNFRKMDSRRVVLEIGVENETEHKKLKKIPEIIKNIVENIEIAEFERTNLKSLGTFSILYEIVYSLNTSDYSEYMNIQEELLLNILEAFEKEGIGLPYPTQKILYEKDQSA